ncbi:MAG TPA: hypothetical protein VK158_00505 [Acidobacteriota bacterium]|nr:hypothetical protein [Acidobacteriota bacterium]
MKYILALFAMLFVLPFVAADAIVVNDFYEAHYDTQGNFITTSTPVTDVQAIGFVCLDSSCSQLGQQIFGGQTLSSGSTNVMQTTYPTVPLYNNNDGYGVYYFKPGYIAWEQQPTWFGNGQAPGTYSKYLTKMDLCRVAIDEFTLVNTVYPNQPVMINIQASMDATVHSPLDNYGPLNAIPQSLKEYYQVKARVTLNIYNSAGQLVNTQTADAAIDFSGTAQVDFVYTPTVIDTYTARVSTQATDSKCRSSDAQSSQKNFYVIQQNPTNQCYTLLNDLKITPIDPKVGQPTTVEFTKITNYYNANGDLNTLPTLLDITVIAGNSVVSKQQKVIEANSNIMDPKTVSFQYVPTVSGYNTITVNATAQNCPYNLEYSDTVSQTFFVQGAVVPVNNPPVYSALPTVSVAYNSGFNNNLFNMNNYVMDPDGDALTHSIVVQSQPSIISCVIDAGANVDCTAGANRYGCSQVNVQVSDGKEVRFSSFNACVIAPNNAPTLVGLPDKTIAIGQNNDLFDLDNYANDADANALTFVIATQSNPSVASCSIDANNMIDCSGFSAGYSDVTVVANDGSLVASDIFRVTVQQAQPTSCTGPDGSIIASGTSKVYFAMSSVPYNGYCQQESRFCNNGVLSGSYSFASCTVLPQQSCTGPDGTVIASGSSKTYFQSATVPAGQNCQSELRVCNNGQLYGTYTAPSCTVQPAQSCIGPDGSTIANGASKIYYQNRIAPYGQSCNAEYRTCNNGQLSGSFQEASCTVQPASSCTGPDGSTIADGNSRTYYLATSVPFGQSCQSESRVCSNGQLSGSFQAASCVVQQPTSCIGPDGTSIVSGGSKLYFATASVPYGQVCSSEFRVCTNGVLTGSYAQPTCTIAQPLSCTGPDGATIISGTGRTYFQSSSVPAGQSCQPQTRVCDNGQLSGSYTAATCQVQEPVSCTGPDGVTISSGSSRTYYQSTSVPFGQNCVSESRVCNNGQLSGSYSATSCTVQQAASCTGPDGVVIASASSRIYYESSSVAYNQVCQQQTRSCYNGQLSGSYTAGSCTVQPAPSCTGPDGVTIASGTSRTYFLTQVVPYGQSCISEARSCNAGSLSGSFTFNTCTVSTNQPPTLNLPSIVMYKNTPFQYAFNISNYVSDPENNPLTYSVDVFDTTAAYCSVIADSLYCGTNPNKIGTTSAAITAFDGINAVTGYFLITVLDNRTVLDATDKPDEDGLVVNQFRFADTVHADSYQEVAFTVTIENDGSFESEDMKVVLTAPELGVRDSFGPLDLKVGQKVSRTMYLPFDYVTPGYYMVRLTISDSKGLQRTVHREVLVE